MGDLDLHAGKTGNLIFEILRIHGRLIAAGDALTADLGLTSARWQVLGTVRARSTALTVSDLARLLGQSRQSIQRLVNEMTDDGLLRLADNPGHKRASLLVLTEKGSDIGEKVERRRIQWTAEIAAQIPIGLPQKACEALENLRQALDD